ncbi:DUF4226 domain-containing protein [[Mycobacterium] vasticus]|uniref:DUF4226 domain-containing protein n=1 Tax=[Mycobacterium] vasticus TaxID=2875777 RepID=A0ABU5YYA0_9MYCO|nr:DUF4226 domain-containing protein [Mycolicibacter sp. MYC017]MEB3069811.1 DUF4226 domain-containing protein [Mycolicibacter sp. MYC017]
MPDELGAFADAARAREAVLVQRLTESVTADREFEGVLRGAHRYNLFARRRLDAIEADIRQAAARWPALETPAGSRQFQQFLAVKTREVHQVVADAAADSRARAATVQALTGRYSSSPADRPAPWPWDNTVSGDPKPGDLPIDDEAWKIASKSPTLLAEWEKLKAERWKFTFKPNEGTYTQYGDSGRKENIINIDPSLKNDPAQLVNAISHEMGHALYGPPQIDRSARESCIKSQLDNEGAATMNMIKVEREILANGGPDIVRPGGSDDKFERIYDTYLQAGSTQAAYQTAITAIGQEFGSLHPSTEPASTYHDYYGQGCPAK